jgi:signal transduction histidine kinase
MSFPRLSLLGKIWLSVAVALTVVFAAMGVVAQRRAVQTTSRTLDDEVQVSFRAYESLWRARAERLAAVTSLLSSMPNVRAVFGTGDAATIRDSAREFWPKASGNLGETTLFVVTDPNGLLIASLDEGAGVTPPRQWPVVRAAASRFPQQVTGFDVMNDTLYQFVVTPVYVDSARGPALITVLVAGYQVNDRLAGRLKEATGGSEFLFESRDRIFASTLDQTRSRALLRNIGTSNRVTDGSVEYIALTRDLIGLEGKPVGRLRIFRSFETAAQHIAALRRDVALLWVLAVSAGLGWTYLLARRIIGPVKKLDRAAAEVARQNYAYRVHVDSRDELGRLADTFNSMCGSLESARAELIRQERISTIGRIASSIVHDLRNPLAAVYGGAEILVDTELPPGQVKRVAGNIYSASRRISSMLQSLVDLARGKTETVELCTLKDVVLAGIEPLEATASAARVDVRIEVPDDVQVPVERMRIERVFSNLVANALEVMPHGGAIRVTGRLERGDAVVEVEDTGPGISPEIRDKLFQPFVSFGKKGGLGLGLALSRQAVLDNGGDLWADSHPGRGARFCVRLPNAVRSAPAEVRASLP